MFAYPILTEEEVQKERYQLMENGIYDAVVDLATPKVSKNSGNQMIELSLTIYDKNGCSKTMKDYLIATKSMAWKTKHFCDSAGLEEQYKSGTFDANLADRKCVKVSIKTQDGQEIPVDKLNGKPYGSKYPMKNVIEDYVVVEGEAKFLAPKAAAQDLGDDIPF